MGTNEGKNDHPLPHLRDALIQYMSARAVVLVRYALAGATCAVLGRIVSVEPTTICVLVSRNGDTATKTIALDAIRMVEPLVDQAGARRPQSDGGAL